jgi:hypothetical protein
MACGPFALLISRQGFLAFVVYFACMPQCFSLIDCVVAMQLMARRTNAGYMACWLYGLLAVLLAEPVPFMLCMDSTSHALLHWLL